MFQYVYHCIKRGAKFFKEQKKYTAIGSYWERGNKNEIDIVAVDDWTKKILICEVKLQEKKLNLSELVTKSEKLLQKYSDYDVEYRLLSVKDLKNF
ncbi:MAG TPA: hypothetical protein EYH57_06680 [Sulfurovum sp.]|nr:hypothetical protein [Sulfurovum sp.]